MKEPKVYCDCCGESITGEPIILKVVSESHRFNLVNGSESTCEVKNLSATLCPDCHSRLYSVIDNEWSRILGAKKAQRVWTAEELAETAMRLQSGNFGNSNTIGDY